MIEPTQFKTDRAIFGQNEARGYVNSSSLLPLIDIWSFFTECATLQLECYAALLVEMRRPQPRVSKTDQGGIYPGAATNSDFMCVPAKLN